MIGRRVERAILLESGVKKLGNVYPGVAFDEMKYEDFCKAAREIGHRVETLFSGEATPGLGELVRESVAAMLGGVGVNTSLGTILLIAPMSLCSEATYPRMLHGRVERWDATCFRDALSRVFQSATAADSQAIYEAIRMTQPGGLGVSKEYDVSSNAPASILEAMRVAAAWDDIALQYTNGFEQVCQGAEFLLAFRDRGRSLEQSVRMLQLSLLKERPDSLIVRKHGQQVGREIQSRAIEVLGSGEYGSRSFETAWEELDGSMRVSGKRQNPGTTADLIAASLFLAQDAFDE